MVTLKKKERKWDLIKLNEDHELVVAMRNKWYACYKVILESGLDDMYMEFVINKQKPY